MVILWRSGFGVPIFFLGGAVVGFRRCTFGGQPKAVVIEIRKEEPDDIAAIRAINRAAFQQYQEAHIVDALRANGAVLLSLVAADDGQIVGHILYSPAYVGELAGAALGPVAVLPDHQRQGIGSHLIDAGNRILEESACPFVIVLGHASYYTRFGFTPASRRGIRCEWDVPDDAFMVLVLNEAKMEGVSGLAKYRPEFSSVS